MSAPSAFHWRETVFVIADTMRWGLRKENPKRFSQAGILAALDALVREVAELERQKVAIDSRLIRDHVDPLRRSLADEAAERGKRGNTAHRIEDKNIAFGLGVAKARGLKLTRGKAAPPYSACDAVMAAILLVNPDSEQDHDARAIWSALRSSATYDGIARVARKCGNTGRNSHRELINDFLFGEGFGGNPRTLCAACFPAFDGPFFMKPFRIP